MDLKKEITRLAPWHFDVQVTPELKISDVYNPEDESDVSKYVAFRPNARENMQKSMLNIYPDGLDGRSFLECGCNCAATSFWMNEIGAGRCFGFDVREHWIEQARFLKKHRPWPSDQMRFEICDIYNLKQLELEPFDVTFFEGLFYHLPDPITGLQIAADLTKEVLFLNTSVKDGEKDGMLSLAFESEEHVMSGAHGLAWLPTGPEVLKHILTWLGFVDTEVLFSRKISHFQRGRSRLRMVASKVPGLLEPLREKSKSETSGQVEITSNPNA